MKRIRWISLLLLVCLALSSLAPAASAEISEPLLQSAEAVLVVDMTTGVTLYEKNADDYHSIASLTKIMTCLLAVEAVENGSVSLTEQVTAGSDCLQGLDTSSSNAGITPGEIFTFQDLIYMALVHSANDACNVIASRVGGSIGAFVNMMNARAQELGCTNTQFVDADGMLNRTEGHYSCPRDLYKITKEALTHPLFATVCSTADYQVSATNYREAFMIHNSNALLSSDGLYGSGYIYDGVIGVKTGFTKPAGYCLVSACKRSAGYIMVIVLGCNGPLSYTFAGQYQNFQDSATLYDWAYKNFTNKTVFLAGEPLKRLSVERAADNGTVALLASENLTLLVPADVTDSEVVVDIQTDSDLVAPIEEGQELGTANVYVRGKLYSSVRLTADASVGVDKKLLRQESIRNFFSSTALKVVLFVLALALIGIVGLRLFAKMRRKQALQRRMAAQDSRMNAERRAARMQQRSGPASVRSVRPRAQYSAAELSERQTAGVRQQNPYARSQTPSAGRQNPQMRPQGASVRRQTAKGSESAFGSGSVRIERVSRPQGSMEAAQAPRKTVIHSVPRDASAQPARAVATEARPLKSAVPDQRTEQKAAQGAAQRPAMRPEPASQRPVIHSNPHPTAEAKPKTASQTARSYPADAATGRNGTVKHSHPEQTSSAKTQVPERSVELEELLRAFNENNKKP